MILPWISVTVQVTVVLPTGYDAGALFVTLATPQLSPVTGVPKATLAAAHEPLSAFTVMALRPLMVGFSLSVTVTVKVTEELPTGLVAVAVTVVTPTGNTEPG